MDAFLSQLNGTKKKSQNNGSNVGKKYFELIEGSSLAEEQKNLARHELMQVIQEVRGRKIDSFRTRHLLAGKKVEDKSSCEKRDSP
jgi:hypothetical protein